MSAVLVATVVDYESMTLQQLQDEFLRLAQELATLTDQRRLIDLEMQKRLKSSRAAALLQDMAPEDMLTLRSELDKAILAIAPSRAAP